MPGFNENEIRPLEDNEVDVDSHTLNQVSMTFQPTDFVNLTKGDSKTPQVQIEWTLTDYLIVIINPALILLMVWSIVFFLLDVRYVYTEVHDPYLRLVGFFFVLGVVALNRLFAREGVENGILYGSGLAIAIALYTVISTTMYGMGSVVKNFMNTSPGMATFFNLSVVIFLWWLTNRITYECCIDENSQSGDVGILTSISKNVVRKETKPKKKSKDNFVDYLFYEFEAVDPAELGLKEEGSLKELTLGTMGFGKRLSSVPAGISVIFFSIPVMMIFSLGLRILVNGGEEMVKAGWFYTVLFVFSAILLLCTTSLGGLREYFKARKVPIPSSIGVTWISGGFLILVVSMTLSAYLPFPTLPTPIHVLEHEYDPWIRGSKFTLNPVIATPIEIWEQQKMLEKVGIFILGLIVIVVFWVLFKWSGFIVALWLDSMIRKGHFDWLKKILSRVFLKIEKSHRKVNIKSAKSVKFVNSLSDPVLSRKFTPNQHIEYAYRALCALADDLGVPKKHSETPLEFLVNLPAPLEQLREEVEELTLLYQAAVYSPVELDPKTLDRLRKFWISYTRLRNRVLR
ncbi:MAG: DUF4129 domain-containing protein [Candidatus Hydrogenedentes bacterium]|nr:DUF4129 domain-containing protein [Candidatus Hydrogenedentota bacterium]